MSEDFEAMLEKMDEKFDLSFDDPSKKEESAYQPELLPKINPEKQSPESSTNEECRKQDSP